MPGMIALQSEYAGLGQRFGVAMLPLPVDTPRLFAFNAGLADRLGTDLAARSSAELAQLFSGNRLPEGTRPVAMAYAGHQFGNFVPQLGDGRAVLLGELRDDEGRLHDVHLKGAGATPFSRGGDGRSALGPVIREYLVSEAMHALGVPTTRALAAIATGEVVHRETPRPGGILARVARSHVRVGTFQYFAARRDLESLERLVDHVVERLYPEAAGADRPVEAMLTAVVETQARLVARWLALGFVHGVMNTDNMSIAGETIDYGPCAFMEAFDPTAVWSSIDRRGRYAYSNQPPIAQWNLARLAETLLPLIDPEDERAAIDRATELLQRFAPAFETAWLDGMRAKIGLTASGADDAALIQALLDAMQSAEADFTLTFRHLADLVEESGDADDFRAAMKRPDALDGWLPQWRARLASEGRDPAAVAAHLRATNPALIPRNHLVEAAIRAAEDEHDFSVFERLRDAWRRPYAPAADSTDLMRPAAADERVTVTFCGT
jgi:uncharacterized protein YdiU (UPF0061 family)